MKSYIQVTLFLNPMGCADDITMSIPIDFHIIRDLVSPIDWPAEGHAIEEFICTPAKERIRINKQREEVSKDISETLTKAIMEILSKKDLINGYPKKETYESI